MVSPQEEYTETMLNEKETSLFIKMSRSWLRQARMKGTGPKFCKFGRAVRYPLSELSTWIESKHRMNTICRRRIGRNAHI